MNKIKIIEGKKIEDENHNIYIQWLKEQREKEYERLVFYHENIL